MALGPLLELAKGNKVATFFATAAILLVGFAAVSSAVDDIRWWPWRNEFARAIRQLNLKMDTIAKETYEGRLYQERNIRRELLVEIETLKEGTATPAQVFSRQRQLEQVNDRIERLKQKRDEAAKRSGQ